jgi:hypothetical protein
MLVTVDDVVVAVTGRSDGVFERCQLGEVVEGRALRPSMATRGWNEIVG